MLSFCFRTKKTTQKIKDYSGTACIWESTRKTGEEEKNIKMLFSLKFHSKLLLNVKDLAAERFSNEPNFTAFWMAIWIFALAIEWMRSKLLSFNWGEQIWFRIKSFVCSFSRTSIKKLFHSHKMRCLKINKFNQIKNSINTMALINALQHIYIYM